MIYPMQCRSQHNWTSKEQSSEVCLKLTQLLIKGFSFFALVEKSGAGDFTQFHSVPGPYESNDVASKANSRSVGLDY